MQEVHEEALAQMRSNEGRWAAYKNKALDSGNVGHMQFLKFGAECTYTDPPYNYPVDTAHGMGWRYRLVGEVDLKLGTVGPVEP